MDYLNLLQSLGLTKTEAQLYIVSLELGPASAIELGQKIGFSRQLMYNLLPSLIQQGFIKQITIGKRHYFQAVSPEILQDKVKKLQTEVASAIPNLKKQQSTSKAVPHITIYDNPLSMREWYRAFIKQAKRGEEKLVYSTEAGWLDLDTEFYAHFAAFEKEKGIMNRIIAPDTSEAHQVASTLNLGDNVYRFASEGWSGDNAKWIWRDQIVLLTIRGKATNMVVIESNDMANMERFSFERVWKTLQ
jgi:sugar-specific transcriptional regulator TrmB